MPKTIPSPVPTRWPGTITLAEPLNWSQYATWWAALQSIADDRPELTVGQIGTAPALVEKMLPGVLACVEKWELGGKFPPRPTPENFPASPSSAAMKLLIVLVNEISAIVGEEETLPLA